MTEAGNDKKSLSDLRSATGEQGAGSVYFIGIGGIGMSALARYFLSKGITVSGYDKTETALTRTLQTEGAAIHYTEDLAAIPKDPAFVIYTPAVPKDHKELVYYQSNGYKVVKRSDVLQMLSETSFNICIGGTHGKTTITAMVAHVLRHSGYGCTAFLGGIAVNYNTNFWSQTPSSAGSSDKMVCVIEADEYDRSFLKLSPDVAVITAMDADHLDVYGDEESLQEAFVQFANKVKAGGLLIYKFGLTRLRAASPRPSPHGEGHQPHGTSPVNDSTSLAESLTGEGLWKGGPLREERVGVRRWTYSLQNESADVYAANIKIEKGGYRFDVFLKDTVLSDCELRIGGMHNVENAVAAVAVTSSLKIGDDKIKAALAAFNGVKRRFEYVLPPKKQKAGGYAEPVLVDDYAHHPEEVRALLTSVRSLFPQRIVTVVFQPHLFTRTRDLADGFAGALSLADRVILLPVYPARELPIEGVSSEMILKKIDREDKQVLSKEEFLAWTKGHAKGLNKEFGEVIVMAGAGDIDALVPLVKQAIGNGQ